jgi:hypothetical protein
MCVSVYTRTHTHTHARARDISAVLLFPCSCDWLPFYSQTYYCVLISDNIGGLGRDRIRDFFSTVS